MHMLHRPAHTRKRIHIHRPRPTPQRPILIQLHHRISPTKPTSSHPRKPRSRQRQRHQEIRQPHINPMPPRPPQQETTTNAPQQSDCRSPPPTTTHHQTEPNSPHQHNHHHPPHTTHTPQDATTEPAPNATHSTNRNSPTPPTTDETNTTPSDHETQNPHPHQHPTPNTQHRRTKRHHLQPLLLFPYRYMCSTHRATSLTSAHGNRLIESAKASSTPLLRRVPVRRNATVHPLHVS